MKNNDYLVCSNCGCQLPVHRSGRKSLNIQFINICDALRSHKNIADAARALGCSRGYIYRELKINDQDLVSVLSNVK